MGILSLGFVNFAVFVKDFTNFYEFYRIRFKKFIDFGIEFL